VRGKIDDFAAHLMKVHRQQVGTVSARLAHEQHQPILLRDDEAVPAAELRGGVDDHRKLPTRRTERAAVVNCVIRSLPEGNADAVNRRVGMGCFSGETAGIAYNLGSKLHICLCALPRLLIRPRPGGLSDACK
jgi:hypothetical protein